ncbi:MAG: hypothetical protein NXY57DRAFT_1091174, partial [Lentinula lateritia]
RLGTTLVFLRTYSEYNLRRLGLLPRLALCSRLSLTLRQQFEMDQNQNQNPWDPNAGSTAPSSVSSIPPSPAPTSLDDVLRAVLTGQSEMRRELQSFRSTVISEFAKYEGRVQQVEAQSLELHQTTKAHSEELSRVRGELSSISEHLVTPTNHETAIQALQAELAALRTQISSNSTALTVSGRPAHNPRMPADSSYDGKTQDGAAEFIRRIEVHSQQVSFSSDRAKILFAMGYLTGKASKWADPFVEDAEDAGSNWDEWRTLFLHQFGDINP